MDACVAPRGRLVWARLPLDPYKGLRIQSCPIFFRKRLPMEDIEAGAASARWNFGLREADEKGLSCDH